MKLARDGKRAGLAWTPRKGTFTGAVWGEQILDPEDGAGVVEVFFGPGGRTHWHRHDGGQVLLGDSGEGYVVTRDGRAMTIVAGSVVHARPGEEHWHGAGPASSLRHMAISIGKTEWLEEVRDDDYAAGCEGSA